MTTSKKTNVADSTDLKKRDRPSNRAFDSIRTASHLSADAFGGVAEAVASGFRAFREELDSDSGRQRRLSSALLLAMFAGQAGFFDELANTARRMFDATKEIDDDTPALEREEPSVDYPRLARLVAEELRKQGATVEGTVP